MQGIRLKEATKVTAGLVTERDRVQISRADYLLVAGTILAPMTGLRVGQVGPGEVLILVWCVLAFQNSRKFVMVDGLRRTLATTSFWIAFIASTLIGSLIGIGKVPDQVHLSQLLTWSYLAVVAISLNHGLLQRSNLQLRLLLERIAQATCLWNFALYFYSLTVAPSFFGAPIWFAETRFSGGGDNPHQVALLLGVAVVVLVWSLGGLPEHMRSAPYNILLAGISLFLCVQTESSTLYMSLVLSLLVAVLVVAVLSKLHGIRRLFAIVAIIIAMLVSFSQLISYARSFVESDANGQGRFDIWSSLPDVFTASPIFGFGPGTHAWGGAAEFHNSYIEVLAMSGLVGLLLFLIYHTYVLVSLRREPSLLPVVTLIMAYGFAGFTARRLPYWIVLILVLVIAQKTERKVMISQQATD